MSDLISREALCEYCRNTKDRTVDANDIMRFPSAEPEIIRCKDCVHHFYSDGIPCCHNADYGYGWEDNDFCSRAERK